MSLIENFIDYLEFKFAKRYLRKALKKATYQKDIVCFLYDNIRYDILNNGNYEKDYQDAAFQFLKDNNIKLDTFIDVGANIGTTALNASKFFKKIYSIEAHPKTFQILKLNTQGIENVEIIESAISNHTEYSELMSFDNFMCGATINKETLRKNNQSNPSIFKVKTTKLDILFEKLLANNLVIKLDIEDEEFNAVLGSKNLIKNHSPVFIVEINRRTIFNGSSKLVDYLRSHDYQLFNVQPCSVRKLKNINKLRYVEHKNSKLEIVNIDELYKIYNLYQTTICIPKIFLQ